MTPLAIILLVLLPVGGGLGLGTVAAAQFYPPPPPQQPPQQPEGAAGEEGAATTAGDEAGPSTGGTTGTPGKVGGKRGMHTRACAHEAWHAGPFPDFVLVFPGKVGKGRISMDERSLDGLDRWEMQEPEVRGAAQLDNVCGQGVERQPGSRNHAERQGAQKENHAALYARQVGVHAGGPCRTLQAEGAGSGQFQWSAPHAPREG